MKLRPLSPADGSALHALISACPPLDVNSPYCYHLLCHHHQRSCVGAFDEEGLCAAITAYAKPEDPSTLFVWQLAVHERARGQGLAAKLIDAAWQSGPYSNLETTIGPGNAASRACFASFARRWQGNSHWQAFLTAEDCGPDHEPEELLRISCPQNIKTVTENTEERRTQNI